MKSLSICLMVATSLACPLGLRAQDVDVAAVLAKFEQAKSEAGDIQQQLMAGFSPEMTAEEQQAFLADYLESFADKVRPMVAQTFAEVEGAAADERLVEAMLWIVQTDAGAESATKAIDLLIEHHADDPQVLQLMRRFQYAPMQWTIPGLRRLIEQEGQETSTRAAELKLTLAQSLSTLAKMRSMIESMPEKPLAMMKSRMGEEYLEQVAQLDVAAVERESIELYRALIEPYGEELVWGKTVKERAESAIYEIENLSVGRVAPDIEGEDIDGNEFKLSDYRGKVVMLDFWGDW